MGQARFQPQGCPRPVRALRARAPQGQGRPVSAPHGQGLAKERARERNPRAGAQALALGLTSSQRTSFTCETRKAAPQEGDDTRPRAGSSRQSRTHSLIDGCYPAILKLVKVCWLFQTPETCQDSLPKSSVRQKQHHQAKGSSKALKMGWVYFLKLIKNRKFCHDFQAKFISACGPPVLNCNLIMHISD